MTNVLIDCPYCGESVEIVVEEHVGEQSYVEDCQVCCRPINMKVLLVPGEEVEVEVQGEDD